jgi:hypothetical protein
MEMRLYAPAELGKDGYPPEWHRFPCELCYDVGKLDAFDTDLQPLGEIECGACGGNGWRGIKDVVRAIAGNRCVRCLHPYEKGAGEWSPCDERCTHDGPFRAWSEYGDPISLEHEAADALALPRCGDAGRVEARWRILTVHHLDGNKANCRWMNLVALCQRCHLAVQGKVVMEQSFMFEHSDWFKVYAAAWYALKYEDREITRAEAEADLERLLGLERLA